MRRGAEGAPSKYDRSVEVYFYFFFFVAFFFAAFFFAGISSYHLLPSIAFDCDRSVGDIRHRPNIMRVKIRVKGSTATKAL